MKNALLLLAVLSGVAVQAQAASPQAWKDMEKNLLASCLKASQLKDVKAVGGRASFDDRLGYEALLLQGRYPQKHMNNRTGTELCLYQRKSGQATVTEWDTGKPLR